MGYHQANSYTQKGIDKSMLKKEITCCPELKGRTKNILNKRSELLTNAECSQTPRLALVTCK